MTLAFLYSRRVCCDPNPEYRQDALELLQRRRCRGGQSIADSLRKNAFQITHDIYPDQIGRMDPSPSHHLRVGPTRRKFECP